MKTSLHFHHLLLPLIALGFLPLACGGGGSAETGSRASCTSSTDCPEGEACIGLEDQGACRISCSVSANDCGGSASCEGIGGVSLNICKEKEEAPAASGGSSSEEAEEEAEEDWLRCLTDEDCSVIDAAAICGTWKGISICTETCSGSSQCNPPTLGGITTSFLACDPDEKQTTRSICVPREQCFGNPTSCIQIDTPDEPDGGGSGGTGPDTGSGGFGTGGGFDFEF